MELFRDRRIRRGKTKMRKSRWKSFLIVTFTTCTVLLICGYVAFWISNETKSSKEVHFRNLLAHDVRIENIEIEGYEDLFGMYKVGAVRFSIRDKPNSNVVLSIVPNREMDYDSLRINEIDGVRPVLLEWDDSVSRYSPRFPALGTDNDYKVIVPWEINDVSGIVSHYEELTSYFSSWPSYPNRRTIRSETGKEFQCYIERVQEREFKGGRE